MLDDAQKQTERIIRVSFEPPLRKKSSGGCGLSSRSRFWSLHPPARWNPSFSDASP
jgi:hypothetical protein